MAVVPRIGTEFAGYRIEALLGRGGMSIVYRAENARLGNKVALKLLAEELANDESFRERFVRESRTAAALNHPNIIPIYDAGDCEGVLYIAMRWVDSDLKAHLRREGPLAPDHVIAVAAQIGSALDAAHARGLLHRDVKPANILLEPGEPGSPPIAYLADFGLTKHLESRSGITASGQFVGTIDYMSPEQIEGKEVDSRTDVYSLGCVVFESLAGATPFRRETEVAVLWAHMREDPPPLTELRPELPQEIDSVVATAMAKAPEERYGTCRELVADLRLALGEVAAETYAGRAVADSGGRRTAATTPERTVVKAPASRKARRWLRLRTFAWALIVLVAGVAIGWGVHELAFSESPKTRVVSGRGSPKLTLDQQLLARSIPSSVEPCDPTEPPDDDFNAGYVCRPEGSAVTRVMYFHPKAGSKMAPYFHRRAVAEEVGTPDVKLVPYRNCGVPPSLREWRRRGKAGHRPLRIGERGADGRFLCFRRNNWAAIEWTDSDVDIYSVAYGPDMIRLRGWWETRAGPVQSG